MKKVICLLCLAFLTSFACHSAVAGEVDILVKKLVEKGILTQAEADELLVETKKAAEKELAESEGPPLPKWVQNTRIKGDLRLRYQGEKRESDKVARHRGRVRYRLGIETGITDKLMIGAGICTGTGDPRTANQTFQDTFSLKSVYFNQVYASWKPAEWMELTGGKFTNPLWLPADLLWSADENPEGAALKINYKEAAPKLDLFFNTAFLVLDESLADGSDPWMMPFQPGFKWQITDKISLKMSGYYYLILHEQGTLFDYTAGSNSRERFGAGQGLNYQFDSLGLSGELGIDEPLAPYIPYCSIYGETIYNPDPDGDNKGGLIGVKFGDKKVDKRGQWQVSGLFRYMEKDAWLDSFLDPNVYSGMTNVAGPKAAFIYGLYDNVSLGLAYYHTALIEGPCLAEDLFQVDMMYKF